MNTQLRFLPIATKAALLAGTCCAVLALSAERSAAASPTIDTNAAVPASAAVIPFLIDGTWYRLQSDWLEQCSATLYIQTSSGSKWPSEDWSDYTKIARGPWHNVKPYSNGGNDGEFNWRCGSSFEESDAGSSDFNMLHVKHSNGSREITMMALDKCGSTMQSCF